MRTDTQPGVALLRRPAVVRLGWFFAVLAVLVVLMGLSIAFGTRIVSWEEIVSALSGHGSGVAEAAILSRIPRTALAVLVGASLAIAGATMQGVTRNPLADPGILGVSAGAALAVVLGMAFIGIGSPYSAMALAIAGAFITAVFVYAIGSLGYGGATPLKLALAGAATTAAFTSLTSAVLLPRVDILTSFRLWQVGGVGGANWERIAVVAPVLALGAFVCFATARGMNALALGDDTAASLGQNVTRTRLISAVGAVLLVGAATSIAGPIGFVGLVVPHVCRMIFGSDYRWLLPMSAICGAALLVGGDIIGRIVTRPEEVEVGIITAIIGAPFFVWIVRRTKVRDL